MTTAYTPPDHVVSSKSPEVHLGPDKAIVAAIAGALVGAGTALSGALSDGVVTGPEWIGALVAAIIGAGLTAAPTYAKATNVTLK